MNILERIDSVLNEAKKKRKKPPKEYHPAFGDEQGHLVGPKKPVIIDMEDQAFRMAGLRNCRGPCVGWEDYAAGRDYMPPMYYKSSMPVGPEDTGKRGILTAKESGQIKFDGPINPFSRRHNNIRPWAPGEVLMTMMTRVEGDKSADGLLHAIATKGSVARAAQATHGKYTPHDVEESMQQGAVAAIKVLPSDGAREGVKFTAFLGFHIEQAMKAGLSPGYQDEYRKIRGIKRKIIPQIKSALRKVVSGKEPNIEEREISAAFDKINDCTKCMGTGKIENPDTDAEEKDVDCPRCKGGGKITEPGPKHPYGVYPPVLLKLRDEVLRAISTRDAKEIRQILDLTIKVFDNIREKERTSIIPGITTQGQVGRKPREHGTLIAFNKAAALMQKQRNLAQEAIDRINEGKPIDKEELEKRSKKLWSNFEGIKRKTKYHSPFEKPQEALYKSPGFVGLIAIKKRLDRALQLDIPELEEFIDMSEREQQLLRNREQVKIKEIGGTSMTTRSKSGEEYERTNIAGIGQQGDYLRSAAVREILNMAIAKVSPYRDDSLERKKYATEATKILNAIGDAVDEYRAAQSENVDTTKAKQDLNDIARDLSDADIGEWQEEIVQLLEMVTGTIEIGGGFSDVRQEIKDLKKIAKQDVKLQLSPDAVPVRQYRMLLRLYGIDNYPERDTPEDPEINEQGGKSKWAEAGYPSVAAAEVGKKANVHLWTDIYETTDENGNPVQSVSDANLSHQKKEANLKFKAAAAKIRKQIGESLGYDSIDYRLFTEFDQLLCQVIIEDALPGGMNLISG